jgi:hypothetical protein
MGDDTQDATDAADPVPLIESLEPLQETNYRAKGNFSRYCKKWLARLARRITAARDLLATANRSTST